MTTNQLKIMQFRQIYLKLVFDHCPFDLVLAQDRSHRVVPESVFPLKAIVNKWCKMMLNQGSELKPSLLRRTIASGQHSLFYRLSKKLHKFTYPCPDYISIGVGVCKRMQLFGASLK